jgi:LPXTG-motif cell wall-anchored protein
MKFVRKGILLVLLAFSAPLVCAHPVVTQDSNATAAVTGVRILEPTSGQTVGHDFVLVKFEPANPNQTTSDLPLYQLQLDARAPVTTSDNQVTFTGLQPGPHTIEVQAVDANGTPIFGSQNVVDFVVTPAASPGPATPQSHSHQREAAGLVLVSKTQNAARAPQVENASSGAAASRTNSPTTPEDSELPDTGSALPLLSIIGFGVLMGGIFSARRTR